MVIVMSELLMDRGINKPVSMIRLQDKQCIVNAISLHYLILKSKAELDQLRSGLEILGGAAAMELHPYLV